MNRFLATFAVLALSAAPVLAADAPPSAAPAPAAKPAKPKAAKPSASGGSLQSEDDKTVYAWGYKVGQNLSPVGFSDSELKAFTQGLRDGVTGKAAAASLDIYLPKVGELQQKRVMAKSAKEAEPNKKKGAEFAEKFSKEDGVKPINGGGWYKSLNEGPGLQPSLDDTVKVNYRGTLIDGTEFDSSYKRNEPATFPLKGVIPCWTNGVAMMHNGGKAKLVCPSDVAYGDSGHPPVIPAGATLVFEVELIDIVKPEAPAAPKSEKKSAK